MPLQEGVVLGDRYLAEELLGRGGMGEVWRCRDLEQDAPVAVKVVRSDLVNERTEGLFHSEVVATARLAHPGIVAVYDLLDHDGEKALVMEYRAGQSLAQLEPTAFAWVRDVLCSVLRALAYAHARGVLHLDIKPANVIVTHHEGRPSATLVDFGISRIRTPGRGVEAWFQSTGTLGTVRYMAPEQCLGQLARFGPWTDLYAVGVMAYRLCAGRTPFGSSIEDVHKRLTSPPPPFVPTVPGVPEEMFDWTRALMARSEHDRPTHASDALWALERIGQGAEGGGAPSVQSPDEPDPSASGMPTLSLRNLRPITDDARALSDALRIAAAGDASDARGGGLMPAPQDIVGVELGSSSVEPAPGAYGMFGLRELPMLGRVAEREALSAALGETIREGRVTVTLLEGPVGTGKSRLARAAMESAHELGLCHQVVSRWSAGGSADEGLRGLVEDLLDTRGADRDEVSTRLEFWLGWRAASHRERRFLSSDVAALLRPPPDAAPDARLPVRVAVELLRHLAQTRPVFLWLDDVQHGIDEANALLDALRALDGPVPICVVATRVPSAGGGGDASIPGAQRVEVSPLDLEQTERLVRGLLDVDGELVSLVASRAEGNPLFVTQLLADMVRENAIERRDGRYSLLPGFDVSALPDAIATLWDRRIERSGADRDALSLLAIVRARVRVEVASRLADIHGEREFVDAVRRALEHGLLRFEAGEYTWVHGLLREHLLDSVPGPARRTMHLDAASVLSLEEGRSDVQEERARHLWAAGSARRACDAMVEAIRWSYRRGDVPPRRRRCEALIEWGATAGLRGARARGLAELALLNATVGDLDMASLLYDECQESFAATPMNDPWVLLRLSQVDLRRGRDDAGVEHLERALEVAREVGDEHAEGAVQTAWGITDYKRGVRERAGVRFRDAGRIMRRLRLRADEARVLMMSASVYPERELELLDRAIALAGEASALMPQIQARQVRVNCLWHLGDEETAQRDAEALLVDARRLQLRQTASLVELQRALWAILDERYADAAVHRDAAIADRAEAGSTTERSIVLAVSIVLALADGDVPSAEASANVLDEIRGDYSEPDFIKLLERAERLATGPLKERLERMIGGSASDP